MCQPSSLTREKDERLSREGDNSGTSRVRVRVTVIVFDPLAGFTFAGRALG
jgi:hypothetical protein